MTLDELIGQRVLVRTTHPDVPTVRGELVAVEPGRDGMYRQPVWLEVRTQRSALHVLVNWQHVVTIRPATMSDLTPNPTTP